MEEIGKENKLHVVFDDGNALGAIEDLDLGGLGLRFVVAGLAEQDVAAQSTNPG